MRRALLALLVTGLPAPTMAGELARGFTARTGVATELDLGEDQVSYPAGWFTAGTSPEEKATALALCRRDLAAMPQACDAELFANEEAVRQVFLTAFAIDRHEVSVSAYRRCVQAGRCDPRPFFDADPRMLAPELPITRVSWFEAERYCQARGGHLPSDLQWERAARGTEARLFPWGNAPRDDRSNHGRFSVLNPNGPYAYPMLRVDPQDGHGLLARPGSFPDGSTPEGVQDLAGNAMEWMAEAVGEKGPLRGAAGALPQAAPPRRMLRGGSFRQPLLYHRATAWEAADPELRSPEVGFRCVSERVIERR